MPSLNAIGIVASDMARSIAFYRLLGLDVPETPNEGHVDTFLPNGIRFMLDTEEVVKSFKADWARADGNQLSIAFECGSPGEVDEVYARVVAGGFEGERTRGMPSGVSGTRSSPIRTASRSTSTQRSRTCSVP